MSPLRSSVLIVGHPHPNEVSFGVDFCSHLDEATELLRQSKYSVLVFPIDEIEETKIHYFLRSISRQNPNLQKILVKGSLSALRLKEIVNSASIFKFLDSFQDIRFERSVQEALEEAHLVSQNEELFRLVQEQNEELKRLSLQLEERVDKRQKSLKESRRKFILAQDRYSTLHAALVAIHRSHSIGEMEILLNQSLKSAFHLAWTRIFYKSPNYLVESQNLHEAPNIIRVPLFEGRDLRGDIFFAREGVDPFNKEESHFLHQIAEAVGLALDRTTKIEQSENLKGQWEATFDAILSPVSIIDENYNIVRTNRAFADRSGQPIEELLGQKCYKTFFKKSHPCENCHLGEKFRIKQTEQQHLQFFEVLSQSLNLKTRHEKLFLQIYYDVSHQVRLERQFVESAKLAELGTIGSSIAHELNNPLGGMINFIQLIKMELKGNEPYHQDILEMEKGVLKCKETVQNLLGFSRRSDLNELRKVKISSPLEQAIKLTEMQTRALSIKMDITDLSQEAQVFIRFNLLSQVLVSLIQIFQNRLRQDIKTKPGFRPDIFILIERIQENKVAMILTTNFLTAFTTEVFDDNTELNFTVARKVLDEMGGDLAWSSSETGHTSATLVLPLADEQA